MKTNCTQIIRYFWWSFTHVHLCRWVKVGTVWCSWDEDGRSELVRRVGDAQSVPGVQGALQKRVYNVNFTCMTKLWWLETRHPTVQTIQAIVFHENKDRYSHGQKQHWRLKKPGLVHHIPSGYSARKKIHNEYWDPLCYEIRNTSIPRSRSSGVNFSPNTSEHIFVNNPAMAMLWKKEPL